MALRHQIGVLRRSAKKRLKLTMADRVFWAWLSGAWADWRSALVIVKPETVIAWAALVLQDCRSTDSGGVTQD